MSQARDIIADASDTPPSLAGAGADDILAALRGAANASPGDSIVIGPDGAVGRLKPAGKTLMRSGPEGSVVVDVFYVVQP